MFQGADTIALAELETELDTLIARYDQAIARDNHFVEQLSTLWRGPFATLFVTAWTTIDRIILGTAHHALTELRQRVTTNRNEQDQASNPTSLNSAATAVSTGAFAGIAASATIPKAGIPQAGNMASPGKVDADRNQPFLSEADLRTIVPTLSAQRANDVLPHLSHAMREADITTKPRQAACVAQMAHESGGFHYMEEIADGSKYEGRTDLGNTQPGDGMRYKGRGYIQVTGRYNYEQAGKALGLDLIGNPDLAAKPENAARIAAWYWEDRGLNELADRGEFTKITKRINGGLNGQADRRSYYDAALRTL